MKAPVRVLVTGASGFVGSALLRALANRPEYQATGALRVPVAAGMAPAPCLAVGDLGESQDWSQALAGQDVVVHTAARVHVLNDRAGDALAQYRRANVAGTLNLARQAHKAGVRRLVFVSSIKVNGEASEPGRPFGPDDAPRPQDAYGLSKTEAEDGLLKLAVHGGMEVVIIRPPLVYGPGVRANFATMMRCIAAGVPLPLGAVTDNRRSLAALDNLVDLLIACIDHRAAANQIFLASDGDDLSTAQLLRRLALAMGRNPRLISAPPALLQWSAGLLGRKDLAQRLCGSLQVDIAKTRTLLGWQPVIDVDEGLRRAAAAYS